MGYNTRNGKDWDIKIYLDNFHFRKNANHIKVAKTINKLFMIEFVCAIYQEQKVIDEDIWCAQTRCPPVIVVEEMNH